MGRTPSLEQALLQRLMNEINEDFIQKVVVAAVILRGGKVLLLERSSSDEFGGLVELPSGTVEPNERLDFALAREILEETALSVISFGQYLGSFDYLSRSEKRTRQYNFEVHVSEGEIRITLTEHQRFFWVDPKSELFEILNISGEVREIIQHLVRSLVRRRNSKRY